MTCRLNYQYGLSPTLSPWSCLMVIGLCLALVTITGPDLQIDFLVWPWPCLIAMYLPEDLDSWLNLAAICFPWSLCWVLWDWLSAGVVPVLLTVFSCPWGGSWPLLLPDRWKGLFVESGSLTCITWIQCTLNIQFFVFTWFQAPSLTHHCYLQLWSFPQNYLELTCSVVSLQILHLFSKAISEYTD